MALGRRPELSPLGAPLPRGLACVAMYAGPHRRGFAFFLDVVAAISDEGPGMAVAHHVGPKVAAIGAANRDSSAVAIEGPGFAGNVAVADEGAQVFGTGPVAWRIHGPPWRPSYGTTSRAEPIGSAESIIPNGICTRPTHPPTTPETHRTFVRSPCASQWRLSRCGSSSRTFPNSSRSRAWCGNNTSPGRQPRRD
jgi:hypothetical protein